MTKYRLIVTFVEGEFMLLRDFNSASDALNFAKIVGFSTYEVTSDFNELEWTAIDPTLDCNKVASFAYKKRSLK